jgi:hypothetical protein
MSEKYDVGGMTENWGSVHGIVLRGSLERDADGLSAIVSGQDGSEVRVRGYGPKTASLIETAADRGDPVILRGHIMGSEQDGSSHLCVLIEGPAVFRGVISDIIRSAQGQPPHVTFWLMNEAHDGDGNMFTYLTGVIVNGVEAEALTDLRDGDRVSVEVRDGPYGHIATSPVTVIPRAEPASEDEPSI